MAEFQVITPMGEKAILVKFRSSITEEVLEKLLILKQYLSQKLLKHKVEVINTYSSLLLIYPYPIKDVYGEILRLKQLLNEANLENKTERKIFHIPVCYEEEFSLDIREIEVQKNLNRKEIIRLHSAPLYTVFFIGFLPGFLYLGGLDEKLQISRKEQPRLRVAKGAVGIGENQTGIYPKTSPGGWQIIGNSPVPLFQKDEVPPCKISPGDKVKFYPVSIEEHSKILMEVQVGSFNFKTQRYDS